ncbi:hypothetical protein D3C78_1601430 [compost metagenome]
MFSGVIGNASVNQIDGNPFNGNFAAPAGQPQADHGFGPQLFDGGNQLLVGQPQHAGQLTHHHFCAGDPLSRQRLRYLPRRVNLIPVKRLNAGHQYPFHHHTSGCY